LRSFKQANYKDYPYPAFQEGIARTLNALPTLPVLRICLLERLSAGRSGMATILRYAATSADVAAQIGEIPAVSPGVQVSVNGFRLDRTT
jgi:hypothetical protein